MLKKFIQEPKVKITLIVVAIAIMLYLLIGSWLNYIHNTDKTIQTQWISLKYSYERRTQLLPQFVQVIQYFAPQAKELQTELIKAYERAKQIPSSDKVLTDQALMQDVLGRQMEVAQVLGFMEIQIKQYPVVAQNRQFLMLNMELQSLDQQIEYMGGLVNQNVMIYNSFLTGFPKNWLNNFFLKAQKKLPLPIPTVKRALARKMKE